jgi:prepilin-type N-terminal cleavage/methylation domain-containing protein
MNDLSNPAPERPDAGGRFFGRPARSAFTLIEVIATVILLGIVAVTVTTFVRPSPAKVLAEADRLAAAVRYVQSRALAEERPWRLEFTSPTEYRVGPVGGAWAPLPGSGGDSHTLPPGHSCPSSPGLVIFDAWGRPVQSDGSPLTSVRSLIITGPFIDNNFRVRVLPGSGQVPEPVRYTFD